MFVYYRVMQRGPRKQRAVGCLYHPPKFKFMDHITITELRKEIEHKREEPFTDEQFAMLISCFTAYIARRGLFNGQSVRNAVSRGWMSAQMAHYFKAYALE